MDVVERLRAAFAAESGWPPDPLHPQARATFGARGPGALRVWVAEPRPRTPATSATTASKRSRDATAVAFVSAHGASDLFDGPGAWLSDLYVAPAWRRRGVARALVAAVAAWTRASGGAWLVWHADASAQGARRFYAALRAVEKPQQVFTVLNGADLVRAASPRRRAEPRRR